MAKDLPCDDHHARQLHFVEQVGLFYEGFGLAPMAGRIIGWLLICDPPQQSSTELADVLDASKGSISTNTRMLIRMGIIRRTAVRGRRGAYFEIVADAWLDALQVKIRAITAFRRLAAEGLEILGDVPPERLRRLEEIQDLYAFFESEVEGFARRYAALRNQKPLES